MEKSPKPNTAVKLKRYKLVKGTNSGSNTNSISIEFIPGNMDSLMFVMKVREKAIALFGRGMSLDSVSTNYTVNIRYPDYKKNIDIARKLIKCVELEEILLKHKHENNIS